MKLCADIGGTKSLLGLADTTAYGRPRLGFSRRYLARDFAGFAQLLQQFLHDAHEALGHPPLVGSACLGVAGPGGGRRIQMTNLPWVLDADDISRLLGDAPVQLINDFAAAAYGIDALSEQQLVPLQAGRPVAGAPQVVIGAGSGLGVAFRFWNGARYQVVPGEGGHMAFAPLDAEQDRLLAPLRAQLGALGRDRLVTEHVVSGPGLVHLYRALTPAPAPDANAPGSAPPSAQDIQRLAREGDGVAATAAHHFLRCYGAVAGDHALATLARGGVFIAGGIALQWRDWMTDGRFVQAFCAKGPYSALMRDIPIHLVTEPELGLLGAAVAA